MTYDMKNWGPDPVEGVRKWIEKVGKKLGIAYGRSKRLVEQHDYRELPGIIKHTPHLLLRAIPQLDYLGLQRAWTEKPDEEHAAMMAILSYRNISIGNASKIYRHYGPEDAVHIVSKDPYRLSRDISGIGFETADKIAFEAGGSDDSPDRIRAALYHALDRATDDGDVYVTRKNWLYWGERLLNHIPTKHLIATIEQLIEAKDVYQIILPGTNAPGKKAEYAYYTRKNYETEVRLAKQIRRIASATIDPIENVDEHISEYEREVGIELSDAQREAIHKVATSALTVITGGPGTGKTTVVRAICSIFGDEFEKTMSLAAFAGCAAKRLRESSKKEATTIHRLLAYDPMEGRFTYGADNPLESDIVVLDETSMIDLSLLDDATQAVASGTRLVLIGDVDQLPSIGPGAALKDIIASKIAPTIYLKTIFRQSKRSRIVTNAKRINEGRAPIPAVRINEKMEIIENVPDPDPKLTTDEEPLRDYIDLVVSKDANINDVVVNLVRTIAKRYKVDPKEDIQILSPMRVKTAGANELNAALQAAFNPTFRPPVKLAPGQKPTTKSDLEIGSPREAVCPGDKVMQQRNDYNKKLFNGDLGYILSVDSQKVLVDFKDGGGTRAYDRDDAIDIKLAYASTIHKSQGSEYPIVILVLTSAQDHMFYRNGRNLFYTAITRGKQYVFVVHDGRVIEKVLREPHPRQTLLAERLRGVPIPFRTGPAKPPTTASAPPTTSTPTTPT